MASDSVYVAVPADLAWQLCFEIRQEHKRRRLNADALRCWECVAFSHGNPTAMRGSIVNCPQVIARHARPERAN